MRARITNILGIGSAALAAAGAVLLFADAAFAATGVAGFGSVAQSLNTNVGEFKSLITTASYVGGSGLGMMSLFKFKAHSENPQQIPLTQPIIMALMAGGLVSLPSMLDSSAQTMGLSGGSAATSGTAGAK